MKRFQLHALGRCVAVVALMAPALGGPVSQVAAAPEQSYSNPCSNGSLLCPEVNEPLDAFGRYVGHDEPSLLFYSNVPGSGNNYRSQLRLPEEPPTAPNDAGTGGTDNFQLHPAFWFGMALCDSESSPNPGLKPCPADTDANIADSADPNAPDYIGKHVGSAFVELQFYPPGWVPWPASQVINGGSSCDAKQWCAAILIFALQRNENINDPASNPPARQLNNRDCQAKTGVESFNFAFLTRNGKPQGPPSPLFQTTADTFTPHHGQTLFMNPGDVISVDIHDTGQGLRTVLNDLTTEESGSMTASPANGFQQVIFDPKATTCSSRPYAFHPMYSTSSEHTRVTWAAHSYNTAFSDEIGHFEYCPQIVSSPHAGGAIPAGAMGSFNCASVPTASDPAGADADDQDPAAAVANCAPASFTTLIKINGCTGTDGDFDSPAYKTVWPGSTTNRALERRLYPRPIRFSPPVFNEERNYSRVAFEADLLAIEAAQGCSTITQAGCTNPPTATQFYPIYSTARSLTVGLSSGGDDEERGNSDHEGDGQNRSGCAWQFGGSHFAGTTNAFGGTSTTEYGTTPPALVYPRPTGPVIRFNDYRRVLGSNPCKRGDEGDN